MYTNFEDLLIFLKDNNYRLTPLNLCKFMGELGSLYKHDSILDPACGVSEILQFCRYGKEIHGYSKNEEFIRTAGDILEGGCFFNEDFLNAVVNRKYDLIVSQLPDIILDRNTENIRFTEVEYIKKLLPLLNYEGTLICVVTEKFLYEDYSREVRKDILDGFSLEMIAGITSDMIPEYNMDRALLVIRRAPKKQWVYMCNYCDEHDEIIQNLKKHTGDFWIDVDDLDKRWDRHFYEKRYRELEKKVKDRKFRTIGEIATVYSGMLVMPQGKDDEGSRLIFDFNSLRDGHIHIDNNSRYTNIKNDECILRSGDIVINRFLNKKTNIYVYKRYDPPAFADAACIIIRSRYNSSIASYLIENEDIGVLEKFLKGIGRKHVTSEDVETIKIPDFGYLENNELSMENIRSLNDLERLELKEKLKSTLRLIEASEGKDPDIEEKQLMKYLKCFSERLGRIENIAKDIDTTVKAADVKLDNINEKLDRILDVVENVKSYQTEALGRLSKINDDMVEYERIIIDFEGKVIDIIQKQYGLADNGIKKDERYDAEEKQLVDTFKENWEKLSEESRIYLITSRIVFEDLKEYKRSRDFSPACVPLTKAFELEMKKYLFTKFREYLKNEGKNLLNNTCKMDKLPEGFYKKNNPEIELEENEFVLGTIPELTGVFINKETSEKNTKRSGYVKRYKNNKPTDIYEKYFRLYQEYCQTKLFRGTRFHSSLKDYLIMLSVGIDTIRDEYRNKVAHTDQIIIDDVEECYSYMITGEKVLYSFISKINKSMTK